MAGDPKIRIIDSQGQVLSSFPIDQHSQAFSYAEELEKMDIEFTLEGPSLPETLIIGLGADKSATDQLREEIEDEIAEHEDSCCLKK